MTADELRRLYGFHRWATARLLAAAETLPPQEWLRSPAAASPSPRDALVHLLWSDWIWLRRFFGLSPRIVFDPDDYPDVGALRARWAEVHAEMDELLGPLTDAGGDRRVDYRDLRGRAAEETFGRLLLNLVVGGSYRRGMIAAELRLRGCSPPDDEDGLLAWLRQAGEAGRRGGEDASGSAGGDVGTAGAERE